MTHNYYYFTSIHILVIGLLTASAAILDTIDQNRWATLIGSALAICVHLGALVGTWVTVYLFFQPCALRAAAYEFEHSMATVMLGHTIQHAILPCIVLLCTPGHIRLRPEFLEMLLPVAAFVAYSAYARPCQIYPVENPSVRLPLITGLASVVYAGLCGLWVVVNRHPSPLEL